MSSAPIPNVPSSSSSSSSNDSAVKPTVYVYIPWSNVGELMVDAVAYLTRLQHVKAQKYIVYSKVLTPDDTLEIIAPEDQFYIVGHGTAASSDIYTDSACSGGHMQAVELAQRISNGKLKKEHRTIKMFVCSAGALMEQFRGLAYSFFIAMRNHGYNELTVWGYSKDLAVPEPDDPNIHAVEALNGRDIRDGEKLFMVGKTPVVALASPIKDFRQKYGPQQYLEKMRRDEEQAATIREQDEAARRRFLSSPPVTPSALAQGTYSGIDSGRHINTNVSPLNNVSDPLSLPGESSAPSSSSSSFSSNIFKFGQPPKPPKLFGS